MLQFLLLSLLWALSTSGQTTEKVETVTLKTVSFPKVIITSTEPDSSFTVNCSIADESLLENVHFLQMKILIDGLGSRNMLAVWEKYRKWVSFAYFSFLNQTF